MISTEEWITQSRQYCYYFSEAFDKIHFELLIAKLKYSGVADVTFAFFKSNVYGKI